MTYKTKFTGYTPESDLSAGDWQQFLDANNSATVVGIARSLIGSDSDASDSTSYSFDVGITESGIYIVGVYGESVSGTGISSVTIDGQAGTEVLDASGTTLTVGFYIVDLQSFADGGVGVTFSNAQDRAGIVVWKLLGRSDSVADDTGSGAFGAYDFINVNVRTALFGMAGSVGETSIDFFWTGLDQVVSEVNPEGTSYFDGADKLRNFDDTTYQIGADASVTASGELWGAIAINTPATYFPYGAGAAFARTGADASALWAWNAVTAVADVEVLGLIRPTAQTDNMNCGVAARGKGSAGADDLYTFVLNQSGSGLQDRVAIIKRDSAVQTTLGTASFSWFLNTNYWLRFRVRGTTLQGRVWAEGSTEPSTWNIEVTDSDISDAGVVGIWHYFTGAEFEIGHFEANVLYAAWPSTVPQYWDISITGGPEPNKIAFIPAVGPSIDRRRASSKTRYYRVELPGLSLTEYTAFVDFYESTLVQGTLPFTYTDPFTNVEKTYKFIELGQGQSYAEEVLRSPGTDGTNGLYKVSFGVQRID